MKAHELAKKLLEMPDYPVFWQGEKIKELKNSRNAVAINRLEQYSTGLEEKEQCIILFEKPLK